MRLHYLQHVPFEGLAYIKLWAQEQGFPISSTKIYESPVFPGLESFDWLIIMGGPMSVYEEDKYPWLKKEKLFIEQAIKDNKLVLGICLGAQLIADVLGARVYPGRYKEIGWFPVRLKEKAQETKVFHNFPQEFMAFHWHGDTFDIPQGAIWTAESEACPHQAFVYNERVVALQFHLEPIKESIENLIKNCHDELVDGKYIQSPQEMFEKEDNIKISNDLMRKLLENMLALA